MTEKTVYISPDGEIRGIESDLTKTLGIPREKRVSRVEPVNPVLRILFKSIRSLVSDESATAEWTRRWPCKWQARIFNGPTLKTFSKRSDAIKAEIKWMNERMEKNEN